MMMQPTTIGTSRELTLSIISLPTPGQANIVSVSTEPPRHAANCPPAIVMIGIRALTSANLMTTRNSLLPFALSVLKDEPEEVPIEQGLWIQKVSRAAYRAQEEERVITVE